MDLNYKIIKCSNCGANNRVSIDKLEKAICGKCKKSLAIDSKKIIELNDENFKTLVLNAHKPVLVDFWAPWCGPCKMISPLLEKLADEFGDKILIGKINVDENSEIPSEFGIMSIPTLLFFQNGKLVDTIIGAVPIEKIKQKICKIVQC